MVENDMQNFLNGRKKARTYFSTLFEKNISTNKADINKEAILSGLIQIKSAVKNCDVYVSVIWIPVASNT